MKSQEIIYFSLAMNFLFLLFGSTKVLKYNYINCDFNEEFFKPIYCRVKAISRNKEIMRIEAQIKQTLHNVQGHTEMYKKYINTWRPFIIKFDVNICKFFLNQNQYFVAKIGYDVFKHATNVNHTCPYMKDEISIIDLPTLDESYFKHILSLFPIDTGEYGIFATLYSRKKTIAQMNMSFSYTDYTKY